MRHSRSLFFILSLGLCACSSEVGESSASAPASSKINTTPSGLKNQVLRSGEDGPSPSPGETVSVHYTGRFPDGVVFDRSYEPRGEEVFTAFSLSDIQRGFIEGLQEMTYGEIRRFWIPAKLAYGEHADGLIPAGDLILDIELIGPRP